MATYIVVVPLLHGAVGIVHRDPLGGGETQPHLQGRWESTPSTARVRLLVATKP
jgi:hypothetical protein